METKEITFDGVKLLGLVGSDGKVIQPPHEGFSTFDKYCGAGWSRHIIPDRLFGLNMGPACFYHDLMFEAAERTSADFHHANSVFLHNMLAIHNHFTSDEDEWRHDRLHRIITYYEAVDTGMGKLFFGGFEKV